MQSFKCSRRGSTLRIVKHARIYQITQCNQKQIYNFIRFNLHRIIRSCFPRTSSVIIIIAITTIIRSCTKEEESEAKVTQGSTTQKSESENISLGRFFEKAYQRSSYQQGNIKNKLHY